MNANDVIESYVADVAIQLPRRQRNDVAFELRALLREELQARAEADGREPDAAMATALLQAFGRPAEVAARYRPTLIVIDPADGPAFLRAAFIGLAIIWLAGLATSLQRPIASSWDVLSALGQWWGATVIPSLWWPGVLVAGFGLAAWGRRRRPQAQTWKPRAGDRIHGGRTTLALALVGIVCGVTALIDPCWLLDIIWGGNAAPAAYAAFVYTDTFLHRQGPCLLVLILLNIPLLITVMVNGRWSARMRRVELVLALATCAVLAWTVLDGPVFTASSSDRMMRSSMTVIAAFTLTKLGVEWLRRVRPSPN